MANEKEDVLDDKEKIKDVPPKSKKKLIILIVAVVLILTGAGVGGYFFLMGDDSAKNVAEGALEGKAAETAEPVVVATYVAMPRPFVFNVADGKRHRLVQIKVQLVVRGTDNRIMAKKHIPTLEGALVHVFSNASIEELRSTEGKTKLRADALNAVNESIHKLEGKKIVVGVLFTGFVLQ